MTAFDDYVPAPALRTWDFANWGSYRAPGAAPVARRP